MIDRESKPGYRILAACRLPYMLHRHTLHRHISHRRISYRGISHRGISHRRISYRHVLHRFSIASLASPYFADHFARKPQLQPFPFRPVLQQAVKRIAIFHRQHRHLVRRFDRIGIAPPITTSPRTQLRTCSSRPASWIHKGNSKRAG